MATINRQPNNKHQTPTTSGTVYYDKQCAMCQVFVNQIDQSNRSQVPSFQDYHTTPLPAGISRQAAARSIHYVDSNGQVYRGAQAIFKIMERQKKWKILARIGQFPIILQLSGIVYRLVASHRHRLGTSQK